MPGGRCMRKRGLVLSGGGAKGAYQLGVYKALNQHHEHFDIVVGTSIGSLNGMLIAQGQYDKMERLWKEMEATKVMKDGIDLGTSLSTIMSEKDRIIPFLKKYSKEAGADITPLKNLVHELVEPELVRKNKVTFGLVTVKYPSMDPVKITLEEMGDQLYPEYLIASASCFPVFPKHTIGSQEYIDGGYYDNVPIQFALELGAKDLVVAELNYPKVTHPEYESQPAILTIKPSHDTGSFMDFTHEHLMGIARYGYLDALKSYKELVGNKYALKTYSDQKKAHKFALAFVDLIHTWDLKTQGLSLNPFSRRPHSSFSEITNGIVSYHYDDCAYLIEHTENLLNVAKKDDKEIYDLEKYLPAVLKEYADPKYQLTSINLATLSSYSKNLDKLDKAFLVGLIVNYLESNQNITAILVQLACFAPDAVTAAFFIAALKLSNIL